MNVIYGEFEMETNDGMFIFDILYSITPPTRATLESPGDPAFIDIDAAYLAGTVTHIPDDIFTQYEKEIYDAAWNHAENND